MGDRLAGILGASGVAELADDARAVVRDVPLERVRPNPFQPRRTFDGEGLRRLAASITAEGLLQPLLVRDAPGGDVELVDGERRLRAARLAGLQTVPVLVRDVTDTQLRMRAAVANLQREDLSVIDEVDATMTLVANALGVSPAEARARLVTLSHRPDEDPEAVARIEGLFDQLGRGTWRSFTKNKLRVLNWPEDVLAAMREGGLRYTLAGVVAAAPVDHRAELLDLARAGATHEALRARARELSLRKDSPEDVTRRVLKRASSARELARLTERQRTRLAKLIAEIDAMFADPR